MRLELFDPLERSRQIEDIVMKGNKRLYDNDKFRFQRFYGGIVTAGSRGCNLKCAPCWNYERNECPDCAGSFYSPSEVVLKLEKLARGKTSVARISGCESILGEASARHLASIIQSSELDYVIETNAVCIGAYPWLLDYFEGNNFRFRVSLKANNGLLWEKFTGSNAFGFVYQQRGIEELRKRHIPYRIAFMPQFIDYRSLDYDPYILEDENLRYYPGVKKRLQERGLNVRIKA